MSWNKILLEAVTFGLDKIPVVGSLLEHIAYALWPEDKENVWKEIKDDVEKLVDKKIANEVYNRVETVLGSREDMDGLIGVIQNYLHMLDNGADPDRMRSIWDAANAIFIEVGSEFKEGGYRFLLLPLYTQFANLHLTLLRDGVIRKWMPAEDLQRRIDRYTKYVDKQYQIGADEYVKKNKGSYNRINTFKRQWVLDVLNFRDAWQYYNPDTYAPPVKIPFQRDIFYTLTEQYPSQYDNDIDYGAAPAKPDRNLKEIELIWIQELRDGYNFVQGFISKYDSGTTDYEGVRWNHKMPDYTKKCDSKYDTFCFYKKEIPIHSDNPITAVQAEYEGAAYCLSFGFKKGKWTGYVPKLAGTSNPSHIIVRPPKGYYLTSIWAPDKKGFYSGVSEVLFGFSMDPKLLDNPYKEEIVTEKSTV